MEKIKLIVDSAANLDKSYSQDNNITVVPFKIMFSHSEYTDGIDIHPELLYDLMDKEIPSTSLPSINSYCNALEDAISEGYTHAIIITVSSELSGSYNSAKLATEKVSGIETLVFDSKTVTIGEGFIAMRVLEMINQNKSFYDITNELPKIRKNIDVFFTLESLEHLIKGGRLGRVSGAVAGVLNLKPIIKVGDDGIYHTIHRVRGVNQSLSKICSIIEDYLSDCKCKICIMHGNAEHKVATLYEKIKHMNNIDECILGGQITPVLAVHSGPTIIGIAIEKLQ